MVVVGSWAYALPIGCEEGPICTCFWVVINKCFGPKQGKWCLVKIEIAVDFLVG